MKLAFVVVIGLIAIVQGQYGGGGDSQDKIPSSTAATPSWSSSGVPPQQQQPQPGNIPTTDDKAPCPADLPSTLVKGKDCTRQYKPVCGSDGQSYSNQCEFENGQLRNPSLTMTRSGAC